MREFPEPPFGAFAETHLGPAHFFDEVHELDAQRRIKQAKAVARIFEIEQQHRARGRAAIPRFMLDRVAKNQRLPFAPGTRLVSHAQRAVRVRLQAEMQTEDVARVFVVADMRLNVRAGRESGKARHRQSRDRFHQSCRPRAKRAICRLLLSEGVKAKRAPTVAAVERFLRPGNKAGRTQRDHFIANDLPVSLQLCGERKLRGILKHDG